MLLSRRTEGSAGLQQALALLESAFSNSRVDVEETIAGRDRVVMRHRWAADHVGPIMGLAGRDIASRCRVSYGRFSGDKVAECWRQNDMLQLGPLLASSA